MPRRTTPTTKASTPKAPRKRSPGRKPVITPEVTTRLCDLLKLGMYESTACDVVGISYRTLARWKAEGEEAAHLVMACAEEGLPAPKLTPMQDLQWQFWQTLQAAGGAGPLGYLRIVAQAATGGAKAVEIVREYATDEDGNQVLVGEKRKERVLLPDARMALEIMSRRWPDQWARTERIEMSGRDGKPIEQTVNVGAAAVENPAISAAVDALLDMGATDGHTTTP